MAKAPRTPSNHISEWFGHRIYPEVRASPEALSDQQNRRCPFLSAAKDEPTECIKAPASKGVCTISTKPRIAAPRQDWLVCPYRALDPTLLNDFVGRLFGFPKGTSVYIVPGIRLKDDEARQTVRDRLKAGERVFIYFDEKLGGELSIPRTASSPEFSFDITVFELVDKDGHPNVDRFGAIEIQTMDFHGSYEHAVTNLVDGLRLHAEDFPGALAKRQQWMSERIEGPNIANVFKRTFYQAMFKFQLGKHGRCVGCILAIPVSVWNSWGPHLGNPELISNDDGTYNLFRPEMGRPDPVPAWIYVFGLDADDPATISPINVKNVIATDAPALSYYALEVAPSGSMENIGSSRGMLAQAARRITALWPELGGTLTVG